MSSVYEKNQIKISLPSIYSTLSNGKKLIHCKTLGFNLTMELYSKMLKPSSCIASHRKVLPSDDGVVGYEEVKIHYIINAKQN